VEKANLERPDLILMDVLMPGIDGFQACHQIKSNPELKQIPIIFLSNLIQANLVQKAKEAGGLDFLSKSGISPSDLVDRVKFILDKYGSSAPDEEDTPGAAPLAARKRILIVEDDALISRMWESKLRKEYDVSVANNGPDSLVDAQNNKPDLVLLDIMLPGMDGFAVCQQLRVIPGLDAIPIIFLSNSVAGDLKHKAEEAGGTDVISKAGITPAALQDRVRELLAAHN